MSKYFYSETEKKRGMHFFLFTMTAKTNREQKNMTKLKWTHIKQMFLKNNFFYAADGTRRRKKIVQRIKTFVILFILSVLKYDEQLN